MATLDLLSASEAAAVVSSPGVDSTKLAAITTAVSLRLDELVGPIVRRTITAERHSGVSGRRVIDLRRWPVQSVSAVTEYDEGGSSTSLTEETATTKPAAGFLLTRTLAEPELGLSGPSLSRRAAGRPAVFGSEVAATYVAGRFAATANVDERYKEAARIMVSNLYQRVAAGVGRVDEYDVPRYPFPAFAVPRASRVLLADVWQERAGSLGIA